MTVAFSLISHASSNNVTCVFNVHSFFTEKKKGNSNNKPKIFYYLLHTTAIHIQLTCLDAFRRYNNLYKTVFSGDVYTAKSNRTHKHYGCRWEAIIRVQYFKFDLLLE